MAVISLINMRASVRKAVGILQGDSDLEDPDIDVYLNKAYWEIMDVFPFREKQRTGNFPTVIGTLLYEIPKPVENVTGFAIVRDSDFQHIPLQQVDQIEIERLYNQQDSMRGMPQKYQLENCYVRFWPTPDKIYTIIIRKNTILADIQDSGIAIPQVWCDIIEAGAKARCLADLGDVAKSTFWFKYQANKIAALTPREEKEQGVDYQQAGVYVRGYDDRHARGVITNRRDKW
jgi:hypothetical protein